MPWQHLQQYQWLLDHGVDIGVSVEGHQDPLKIMAPSQRLEPPRRVGRQVLCHLCPGPGYRSCKMIDEVEARPSDRVLKTFSEVLYADSFECHHHCHPHMVVITSLGQNYAANHKVLQPEQNQKESNRPRHRKVGQDILLHQISYGTQNGYSCSCSIEVLQESPRAGTRRTLHYNGIASSYNSVEVDSLYSRTERHDGDGQTEESSQGATDSLCDPWEQSTSSTCTSTSSPRLRTSSCASQCSRPAQEEDRVKPHRRRAFSSSSNHSSRVEETEHTGHHRPRSNSSRLPTPSSSRVGISGEAMCFAPTSPSQSAATSLNSTSTQNSRGIHIRNFRSRLPKRKNHTSQAEASSQPTSPTRNSKAFWPVKYRNKVRKEVMRLINYSLAWLRYSGHLMARETTAWLFWFLFLRKNGRYLVGFYAFYHLTKLTFRLHGLLGIWYSTMLGMNLVKMERGTC